MNPKIEELRKKAFVVYEGMDGVSNVNKEIKKMGVAEDELKDEQLKVLMNNIIKNVFINRIGIEKTKEILAKENLHLPGYRPDFKTEKMEQIRIFERISFNKWAVVFIAIILVLIAASVVYYALMFDLADTCERKKDTWERDSCFVTLALSRKNDTVCDKVGDEMKRFNCYAQTGIELKSMEVCKRIPSDDIETTVMYEKCVMCVAYKLDNRSLCYSFISPFKQSDCVTQIMRRQSLIC
ncbi:MAG: hypothetical protein V1744_07615 [Candidatus Altiarchaeota archaeon]